MKTVVVVYSLTGNSRKVGETLAKILGCDVVEIKENVKRKGIIWFLRSGYEALTKKIVPIEDINIDFSQFDKVLIVCPIWAGNLPSPVRSFLNKYLEKIKDIGFVFTLASDEKVKVEKVFEKDFKRKAFDSISICATKIRCNIFEDEIKKFVDKIRV